MSCRRLGARSVPVLSRGDDYVFAQNIGHVVKFLGLNEATGPVLSPAQLIARLDAFLDAAMRMIPQMPDDKLATEVPNRPRSYRVLGHHIFRIAETFLEVANGARAGLRQADRAAARCDADHRRYRGVWRGCAAAAGGVVGRQAGQVGARDGADLLRPAAAARIPGAHAPGMSASTCGNGCMLLGMAGIEPDHPPGEADFAKLPMPSQVWDG